MFEWLGWVVGGGGVDGVVGIVDGGDDVCDVMCDVACDVAWWFWYGGMIDFMLFWFMTDGQTCEWTNKRTNRLCPSNNKHNY